jgi:3-oxoacyl-[acyl-carrier-protein] synthase-3
MIGGMRAAITATGHHVPDEIYPNAYFAERLETTDEWIRSRTGIEERRFASTGGTSDLAVAAARRCLEARGISAAAVDGIIVATMTPDRPLPSTAAIVQRKLGATHAWGFDVSGGVLRGSSMRSSPRRSSSSPARCAARSCAAPTA